MSTETDLAAWFGETGDGPEETSFTDQVMVRTERLRRRKIARRVMIGLLLAALSIPGQDLAIAAAEVAMVQLVETDNQVTAALLAPINTVGGVLSVILLFLRTVYRRMLRG